MICTGRNTETGAASLNHAFVREMARNGLSCAASGGDYWAVDLQERRWNLLQQAFTWWDINPRHKRRDRGGQDDGGKGVENMEDKL